MKIVAAVGLLFFLLGPVVLGIDYPVTDQRLITIEDTADSSNIMFHAARDTVFKVNKEGGIDIGDKESFYGTMRLVPAYFDGSEWFLCPLENLKKAHSRVDGFTLDMDNPGVDMVCYQYSNTAIIKTQRVSLLTSYSVKDNGRVKIAALLRFLDTVPEDTGFAFFFRPLIKSKYASVKPTTESLAKAGLPTEKVQAVDMAVVNSDIGVSKEVMFLSETGQETGEYFDWADMFDFPYKFSEVVSINGQTGLLLGSYGYGKTDTIIIDPVYTVDYSPIPALYLEMGNVTAVLDSSFVNSTDVTAGVSDNSTGTTYSVFDSSPAASPNSTGLVSPTISAGGWATEANAYADGGSASTAGVNDVSQWSGYSFGIPLSASITDITVRLDLWKNLVGNTHYISCVNLSWNNGTSYTGCQNLSSPTTTEVAYNFSGLWGRAWTANELNNNLVVQVASSSGTVGVLNLDWIPVTVTYTYPSANYSKGSALNGKWSVTYDSAYQYFLRVYKTSPGEAILTAYAYNTTNSISSQSSTTTVSGTGWFNLNVTSLVQYMTSTLGLNYSAFRFYTNNSQSFSEERLRAETNDTTPPTVNYCSTNATSLSCGGAALLECNVTDNIDVDTSTFLINGSNYSTSRTVDIFSYSYSPGGSTPVSGQVYDWEYVYASDILGNLASYDPNVQINYTCCSPNWVAQYGSCETNDSMLKSYSDSNLCGVLDGLPVDNGTYVYCNYCSENLEKHYNEECNITGQRSFEWHDHNFSSCCVITGLISDCSIQYSPYNATDFEYCTALYHDFTLDFDAEQFFGFGIGGLASDKVTGKIWLNDTNNTYSCITYVKTAEGQIVQTNPAYTKRTDSTLAFTQKEVEDREFFVTQQGLANVYWTDHNLVIDGREYIFGVECSGNGMRQISEKVSTVGYKPVNAPITRYFWLTENILPLIIGIIMVVTGVILIGYLWRRAKYG